VSEPRVIASEASARGLRVAVCETRYNGPIVESLHRGAVDALVERGVRVADLVVVFVPGAFELPLAVRKLAASGRYDAVVALGAVVRGDTPHFDYVAGEAARGLQEAALATDVPIVFGVLTTDTLQQALDRVGGCEGHKGEEAAATALEMVELLRRLEYPPESAAATD
jgi:6,7-dimethyl-8-ribityllumazine synthase